MPAMFAGIDWGGARHQLAVVDREGQVQLNRAFAHDRPGLEELHGVLGRLGEDLPVALERSEGLLVEKLLAWGHRVYPVSPRIAARARERYRVASTKDDSFDAYVLADTLRQDHRRWRPLSPASDTLAELRALTRDRRRILETQQGVEAQLRESLLAYHPAVARLFSSVDRGITLAFLRDYPTPERASRVGVGRMERFLARHSYTGRVPPEVLVERLRANLTSAGPGTTAGRARGALALADQLEVMNRQLREYDRAIAEALGRHPDAKIFRSFPGTGRIISANLAAEIGEDRERFPTAASLLAEAGLAPVTRSSGKVTRVRFRYAANRRLRDTFNWWGYTLARIDPWSREIYLAGRDRGHQHYRAIRGLAARWGRVLWRCWQDRALYDREVHLGGTTG